MPQAARSDPTSDTPERILEAALEEFSQKGFAGARTRDIATRAGVNLGLVQYHFGRKDELWKAAVDLAFGNLEERLELLLETSPPLEPSELLRRLVHAHVRFAAENTAFIRIMHDEGKQRSPRMRWLTDRYVRPVFERALPFIQRAQREGVMPEGIDPAHFVYMLVGAAGMMFHQAEECRRLTGIDPGDPEVVEAHVRAVEWLFVGRMVAQEEDA